MSTLKAAIIDSMVMAALAESRRFSSSVLSKSLIAANIVAMFVLFRSGSMRNAYMTLNIVFAVVGIWHQLVYMSVIKHAVESAKKLDEIIEREEAATKES